MLRDIINLAAPKNVSELKAFLRMIQYYSRLSKDGVEPKVYAVTMLPDDFPVTSTGSMIANETRKDVVLKRVLEYRTHFIINHHNI